MTHTLKIQLFHIQLFIIRRVRKKDVLFYLFIFFFLLLKVSATNHLTIQFPEFMWGWIDFSELRRWRFFFFYSFLGIFFFFLSWWWWWLASVAMARMVFFWFLFLFGGFCLTTSTRPPSLARPNLFFSFLFKKKKKRKPEWPTQNNHENFYLQVEQTIPTVATSAVGDRNRLAFHLWTDARWQGSSSSSFFFFF